MPHRLAQHLISRGLLPGPKVDEALKRHAASDAVCIDTVLLEQGLISEAGRLQGLKEPPSAEAAESLSEEVLERIAQGIVEEPVLLSTKKKREDEEEPNPASALGAPKQKRALEVMDEEPPEEIEPEESTSI